ncbi:MAG: MFS transporter [Ilumatobacteraceae bacterium]
MAGPRATSLEPGPATPTRRSILALVLATTATGIMGNTLLAPAIPDILDEFGVGGSGAGWLIAATSAPGILLAPVIGILADRFGRRLVLTPCLAIFGMSGILAALAPSFPLLIATRFGMGIGAAGLINMSVVLIGDHWSGEERTEMIGRNAAFLTVGIALMPPIGGILTDVASWRIALAPYGFGLLTAAFAWRVLPPDRPADPDPVRDQVRELSGVARQRSLLVVFASGTVIFALVFGVFLVTLPLHLEEEFGYGASVRGVFLAIPAIPATVAALNLRRSRSAIGARGLLVASSVALVVGFTLIGGATTGAVIALGCAVYGLGEGSSIPTLQDLAVSSAPAAHRAGVVAVWVGFGRLGQTIGPIAAALLFSATSTTTALLAGALIAAALVAMFAFAPLPSGNPDT